MMSVGVTYTESQPKAEDTYQVNKRTTMGSNVPIQKKIHSQHC